MVRTSSKCYLTFILVMRSSHGFRVYYTWLNFALFRLGFPSAPTISVLTLPRIRKSLVPSPKGTSSLRRAPTLCRHRVSGSISLPFRGSFYLSLTVLVHYRSHILFSLRSWSTWIHTGFHVSDATYEYVVPAREQFQIQGYNLLWLIFPDHFSVVSMEYHYLNFVMTYRVTPLQQRVHPWHCKGLGSSNFARHYFRNLNWFLFLAY